MCCLTQKVIRLYGNCLCLFSTILIMISTGLIYLSVSLSAVDYLKYLPLYVDFEHEEFSIIWLNDVIILIGLTLSGIAIINALWGCGVKMCKSRLCLVPFTIFSLGIIILYCTTGIFMIAYGA